MQKGILSIIFILFMQSCILFSKSEKNASITTYELLVSEKWTQTYTITKYISFSPTKTIIPTSTVTSTITKTPYIIFGNEILQSIAEDQENPKSYFDLDTGKTGKNPDADIQYFTGCGSMCFSEIIPINGSSLYDHGTNKLKIEDCFNNYNLFRKGGIPNEISNYCVLTNKRNVSILSVTKCCFDENGVTNMNISFTTWIY
jgi:hypothetical protein